MRLKETEEIKEGVASQQGAGKNLFTYIKKTDQEEGMLHSYTIVQGQL